jgi:hypothetical protein
MISYTCPQSPISGVNFGELVADLESARHKKLLNSLHVPVKISSSDAVRGLGGREKRVQPSVFYDCNPGKTDYRAVSKSI